MWGGAGGGCHNIFKLKMMDCPRVRLPLDVKPKTIDGKQTGGDDTKPTQDTRTWKHFPSKEKKKQFNFYFRF
jgi:hypothetical protein